MIYDTAADVINGAASECGLTAVSDPYASADPSFIQLRNLLSTCGQELLYAYDWQKLIAGHSFVTSAATSYALPTDFCRMIDQTGWNPTNRLPLGGPLSPQDWTYLVATNLASSTIYVSFRVADSVMSLLPTSSTGETITFEYISKFWVALTATPTVKSKSAPTLATDVILYESLLIKKLLKLRFLEAKGFDTTAATQQFKQAWGAITGQDAPAQILNMARNRVFPYLGWRNIPETNYGLP